MAATSGSQIASSSSSSNLSSKLESLLSLGLEEEETKNSNFAPWLELPDYLTEKILERLPISDYVRFGAVCPQWRSIQENHRRRHAPSPPPMMNLPWFIPYEPEPQQEAVDCFSPLEQRSYRIRLPISGRYLECGIESEGRSWHSYQPNGWLVLDDVPLFKYFCVTLLNPISGLQIELPVEGNCLYIGCKLAVSPPPACLVLLMVYDKWNLQLRLFRDGDDYGYWSELEFPDDSMRWDASPDETCAIVWEGKVYYMHLGRGLMVIDPLPEDPTFEFLDMDQTQLPALKHRWEGEVFYELELFMVESNGKMLLVVQFFESDCTSDPNAGRLVVGFHVFEADFSNKRWLRLECLGDRVLFIHHKFICSLVADDIGAEGNCIYFPDAYKIEESCPRVGPAPWSVFNLGTGTLNDSTLSFSPALGTHLMCAMTKVEM